MSATRLLVLGVVRMLGQAHGYQVRRELLTWSADKWGNVAPGSIYHALKKMAAENLLEEVATEPGRGPERTAYRLTPDGETDFMVRLSRGLSGVEDQPGTSYELSAAMTLMPQLTRERAISLLTHRLTQLESQTANARSLLSSAQEWGQPAHIEELYRLWLVHVEADVRWTGEVIGRLRAGDYVMADDHEPSFGTPVK
ncbi:PadR family transcriptional regulator [Amycolatopsis suaedae]|uniref:PadR family transcriptional regulator n=1 Tax=Amycolatopsis suaedae TaxID=2510978 RepID=A0A4V2EM13_9PSEU|nr:PadR family transcriptional regulator [Amycolatopsis suaedae]RZQ63465.1 PadR family transcriptional regulator [Amycolatopsis suaedae]